MGSEGYRQREEEEEEEERGERTHQLARTPTRRTLKTVAVA